MKVAFSIPDNETLAKFLRTQRSKPFSYQNVGTSNAGTQKGFKNDHNFVYLGQGDQVWIRAKNALNNWNQFPPSWTRILPRRTSIKKSEAVVVLFKIFGIWWINTAKIVYTIDESDKYGFAYGTLPGHVARGEELFFIKKDQNGNIYYHIKAFSKPAYWIILLAFPLMRYFQRRFVKESMMIMQKLSNAINHDQNQL